MASASGSASPLGTVSPVTPSMTISGMPSTAVATTGRPAASDSIAASGNPSQKDGRTLTSASASQFGMSRR